MEGDTWHRGVDFVAVRRVVQNSHPVPVLEDPLEMRLAAAWMVQDGLSDKEIGRRLGIAAKTAERWREASRDMA
ncbi:helix-turn-helix domain containing protein [Streptomyces sp. ME03-5709C]|nr:helix-turn-helix domain containing protein [Streptomyces sp. ME03-5709C]